MTASPWRPDDTREIDIWRGGAFAPLQVLLQADKVRQGNRPSRSSRSRGVHAALRKASGGTVAIMLGRAFMRPSQDSREVALRIAAPSGVAAR